MAPVTAPTARITVADYGMGNLRSVVKGFEHVGAVAVLGSDRAGIEAAEALVLPGVGAFPEAMREIGRREIGGAIRRRVEEGVPLLGICLGMQLLFESSSEHEGAVGLGLLEGSVDPLRAPGVKLPHIGWSPLRRERDSELMTGIADEEPFYFVHSFAARPAADELIGSAVHGQRFAAVVGRGNVYGTQFHPEKSSRAGLAMLGNFAAIAAAAQTIPC
jgi:imidazole glycerol-phosphate synthase subunit HisH